MFRIGEFSTLTQVSIRMLRYYDEIGLLKPSETDGATGYRLYSAGQIPRLQKIVMLRDLRFSCEEIRYALEHWELAGKLLDEKKRDMECEIARLRQHITDIDKSMRDLECGRLDVRYNVQLKSVPALQVVSLRRVVARYDCEGELWQELGRRMQDRRIAPSRRGTALTLFHDEGHMDSDVDIEVAVQVARLPPSGGGLASRVLPAQGLMACILVHGPFSGIGPAYASFAHWLEQNRQLRMDGICRQICHRGPFNEPDPAHYLTQLQTPVKKVLDSPIV